MGWGGWFHTRPRPAPVAVLLGLETLEDRLTPSGTPLFRGIEPLQDARTLSTPDVVTTSAPSNVYPWGTAVDLGTGFSDATFISNSSLQLENFALRTNGTLVQRSQTTSGAWSNWLVIGTEIRSFSVGRHANGRLELFVIGRDNALFTRVQSRPAGAWNGWIRHEGSFRDVSVFQHQDGRLEVFLIGTASALFQRIQNAPNGSWSGINRLGGSFQKVKLALHADGRGEMLGLTTSGQLVSRSQKAVRGSWTAWQNVRNSVVDFDLLRGANNRLEAFAVTQSGSLMQRSQTAPNGSWGNWASIAFGIKQVDAVVSSDGRLQLFGLNNAGKTMARSRVPTTTAWSAWEDLGSTRRILATASGPQGQVELLFLDTRGRMIERSQMVSLPIPDSTRAWNLNAMRATEVWSRGFSGKGIIVAVLDTGVDINHPDLAGNIWTNTKEIPGNGKDDDNNGFVDDRNGWDFVQQDHRPEDLNGHGTHVAGTIAALKNGFGVTGVAPQVKVMPVQVLSSTGKGSSFDIDRGIRYAVDNGARIINISIGGNFNNAAVVDAISYARSKGVLIVVGAGNDAEQTPSFPAIYSRQFDNVLSVGSHNSASVQSPTTNHVGTSRAVQVDAPGEQIYSTALSAGYRTMSGTSMAAPQVSALAALVLSANPNLTPGQLRKIIVDSADRPISSSDSLGGVDAMAAIDLALSRPYFLA
jgi:subtilisin family serine protease